MKTRNKNQSQTHSAVLILGNQLFEPSIIKKHLVGTKNVHFFMREDSELCTYFKFHQHRIVLYLAGMRTYAKELQKNGFEVHYQELDKNPSTYELALLSFLKENNIQKVFYFEIEDKFFEKRIQNLFLKHKIENEVWPSPMFLTTREEFKSYLNRSKKPFMKVFYESQRKNLKILVDKNLEPEGGRWSFDTENRLALPSKILPPDAPRIRPSEITKQVIALTEKKFSKHPGDAKNFWLPVDRKGAFEWLENFLEERFAFFGPYEDAIPEHSDFVFHSVLTPFLNTGLITPQEVVDSTLAYAKKNKISIASTEGFIRQVIGWREFIRGIYQNFSEKQESANFFNHKRKLTEHWYKGTTGIAPLDNTIKKALRLGYTHHIERLMVVGSLMLLLEIEPDDAYRWFMEMYIDSSDWVMVPNVYGMALFADGGIFATKPYFCGSNYYRKMGGYKASEKWCNGVDGLYWGFVEKHKSFFLKNPRLSMMARTVEKMDPEKKKIIYKAAQELRDKLTC